MMPFISLSEPLREIIKKVIATDKLHAKWLNTLSYLENCGARKIAAYEHPTLVKEEMLKHAAEEFRHAYHLKRQIEKITIEKVETYSLDCVLGGTATWHYLTALELDISRYLKKEGFNNESLKEAAYLLITYAIELRAEELYSIYDEVLRRSHSRVVVKSIMLEEQEHLNEMKAVLNHLPLGQSHAKQACAFEASLCQNWLQKVWLILSPLTQG